MTIGPGPILALLVGTFHTALYVFLRGRIGNRLPLTFGAAVLGAWAGDALGGRLGVDLLAVGEFRLLTASIGAWVGILLIAVIATLGPQPGRPARP